MGVDHREVELFNLLPIDNISVFSVLFIYLYLFMMHIGHSLHPPSPPLPIRNLWFF